ncbi:heparan sulfate glucosamine 3-O-sulfotransferase 6 [Rhipicephalus sanguineus]|nr:heparan sulfate glucosamine 3-O-sulfotransferase 6 [Rhipicephalus sanguineus]
MSPAAYRTSVRRLVVYTAALCILIGYAFFAPDLTPVSGTRYVQLLQRQVVDDEGEIVTSRPIAAATLPEDDAIEAGVTFGKIRTGRGKERRDVRFAPAVEGGDLKKSFGRRQASGNAEEVLQRRRTSRQAGRLTLALKTTLSPTANPPGLPESMNGSKESGDVIFQNANPKTPQSTNYVLDVNKDSSSEVHDGVYNASNAQLVSSDYAFSVATDFANGADRLEIRRGVDVSLSNRPVVSGGVRDAEVSDAEVAERPERRLPQAIIIGVKKGGTRAVLEYLRLHPQVRAAGPEPHFFDKNYHRGFGWYRSQMPESVSGQLTMEKTPSYLVRERVPARVRAMSPSVKLVLVLRDPVTRAVSDYTQAAAKGRARRSFLHSVTDNRTGMVDRRKPLVRVGLYDEHVSRWLEHFPRSSFHFVSGERLVAQPERELASIQRFLGLRPPWVGARHLVFNSTKGFPCLLREPGATPHCLDPSKGRRHPKVDPVLEKRLREFYAPHNRRLYRIIGRDLEWPP